MITKLTLILFIVGIAALMIPRSTVAKAGRASIWLRDLPPIMGFSSEKPSLSGGIGEPKAYGPMRRTEACGRRPRQRVPADAVVGNRERASIFMSPRDSRRPPNHKCPREIIIWGAWLPPKALYTELSRLKRYPKSRI
jgi:hypothetical protein